MDWMWWLAIGFVLGFNIGVALSGLLRFASKRQKSETLRHSHYGSSLDGPSTIF